MKMTKNNYIDIIKNVIEKYKNSDNQEITEEYYYHHSDISEYMLELYAWNHNLIVEIKPYKGSIKKVTFDKIIKTK